MDRPRGEVRAITRRDLRREPPAGSWTLGGEADLAWIATHVGVDIGCAIPPVFSAYATVVIPEDQAAHAEHDDALVAALRQVTPPQPWWCAYLDTGGDDIVFWDAPLVACLHSSWRYAVVEAGLDEALTWRRPTWNVRRSLPDLLFPADRSCLVNTLWDDHWRCIGGPDPLVEALLADSRLETRRVEPEDEDVTPPGRVAH